MTLPQLLILQVLGEGAPLSNAQVARRTFVSSQAAHLVSAELLATGLIEKVDHPTNRRVRLVRLTDAGWATLAECDAEMRAREDRLIAEVGRLGKDDSLADVLTRAAGVLAGGYFGDEAAEAAAVARRRRPAKGAGMAPA